MASEQREGERREESGAHARTVPWQPRAYNRFPSQFDRAGRWRLVFLYASRFAWHDAIVLVQFQHVESLPGRKGRVAVEGFHQDGNQHVAMLIVPKDEVPRRNDGIEHQLDRRVWHYGTDIEIADPAAHGGRGYRDVVILSAKEPPAHVPIAPVGDRFKE